MDRFAQDLRYAARLLLRSPGFTVVAGLALALGIGANTATFSVVKTVLLTPPPFHEPERLVRLWSSSPEKGEPIDPVSPGAYAAYKGEAGVFEAIGAASDGLFSLTGDGEPEALIGPSPEVYMPFRQQPIRLLGFAVRTSPEPMSLAGAVRAAIWEVDPDQPVSHVLTLREMAADAVTLRQASLQLMLTFAGLALGLACLGLYGVMAQAVARTQEIGVRLALGASPGDVRGMIVGAGLRTAGVGLAIGLVASLGVTRLLGSLLYGVSPVDPASLLATAAVLAATAFLASGAAALRAGRIDPLQALRYE